GHAVEDVGPQVPGQNVGGEPGGDLGHPGRFTPRQRVPQERDLGRVAPVVVEGGPDEARTDREESASEPYAPHDGAQERHDVVARRDGLVEVERGDDPLGAGVRVVHPQIGSLRNSGRGTCRNTVLTQRSAGGTNTISHPRSSPRTPASATAPGVAASGAGSSPAVIFVCTKPGRTIITDAPVPPSASPRPWKNASSPAFVDPYTKFERRARAPPTDDSAPSVPCPRARSRFATGTATPTGSR